MHTPIFSKGTRLTQVNINILIEPNYVLCLAWGPKLEVTLLNCQSWRTHNSARIVILWDIQKDKRLRGTNILSGKGFDLTCFPTQAESFQQPFVGSCKPMLSCLRSPKSLADHPCHINVHEESKPNKCHPSLAPWSGPRVGLWMLVNNLEQLSLSSVAIARAGYRAVLVIQGGEMASQGSPDHSLAPACLSGTTCKSKKWI